MGGIQGSALEGSQGVQRGPGIRRGPDGAQSDPERPSGWQRVSEWARRVKSGLKGYFKGGQIQNFKKKERAIQYLFPHVIDNYSP